MMEVSKTSGDLSAPARFATHRWLPLAVSLAGFFFLLPNLAFADSLRECLNSPPAEALGEALKAGADTHADDEGSGSAPGSSDLTGSHALDLRPSLTLCNWTAWQDRDGLAAILVALFGSHSATSPPAFA